MPKLIAGYGDYPMEEETVRELADMNIGCKNRHQNTKHSTEGKLWGLTM